MDGVVNGLQVEFCRRLSVRKKKNRKRNKINRWSREQGGGQVRSQPGELGGTSKYPAALDILM